VLKQHADQTTTFQFILRSYRVVRIIGKAISLLNICILAIVVSGLSLTSKAQNQENDPLVDSLISQARQKLAEQKMTEGIVLLEQAIDICKNSGNKTLLVRAYLDKAEQLRAIGALEQALEALEECKPLLKEVTDKSYRIFYHNRKAAILFEIKDHEASLFSVKQAQQAALEHENNKYLLSNLNLEGANLRELGRLDEAIEVFKQIREAALEGQNKDEYCLCLFNMFYTQLASSKKENALETVNEFVASDCSGLPWMMQQEMLVQRGKLNYQLGNLDSAYVHMDHALNRSMKRNAEVNEDQITDLELRLNLAQQNLKNNLLEAENSRKQLLVSFWFVLTLVSIAGLLVFLSGRIRLKKANETLNQVNIELNDALALKRKLIKIVAHDVRGPLSGISSMIELYNSGKIHKEVIDEFLSKMEGSANEVNLLLESILNWIKSQDVIVSTYIKKVHTKRIFDELERQSRASSQAKQVDLQFSSPHPEHTMETDFDLILLVLRNLVSNAIKYSKTNGKVYVSLEENPSNHILKVEDDGVGMSESKIEELTLKRVRSTEGTQGEKGTGIGFELCVEIVELLGGKIHLTSTENVGTCVSLEFPK
jgi:signal transduction histidine kinase/PAS domain-containing protein